MPILVCARIIAENFVTFGGGVIQTRRLGHGLWPWPILEAR